MNALIKTGFKKEENKRSVELYYLDDFFIKKEEIYII